MIGKIIFTLTIVAVIFSTPLINGSGISKAEIQKPGIWDIKLNTDSIQFILLHPDKILADPDHFWKTDRAYQLVDGWHRNTKIPKTHKDYYNKWLAFLKEMAAVPEEERTRHEAFKFLEVLKSKIPVYYNKAIPHIKSFLPRNGLSFKAEIYLTTKTLPYQFMTDGNIVSDPLSPKFKMDADFIFNLQTHEAFHIGYGYNRYARREVALKDPFIYNTLLDSLQNEGMAVYMAYKAQSFYPAPNEQDYKFLENPDEVVKRISWVNEIFQTAEKNELSEDKLRKKAWDLGVTKRAYYVAGAYMAQSIDQELGREALIRTVAEGPLTFVETYNKIVRKGMKIHEFKRPGTITLAYKIKYAVLDHDLELFNQLAGQLKSGDPLDKDVWTVLYRTGFSQMYLQHWPWAFRIFNFLVKIEPENADNWNFLADAYMESGDLEQAEKYNKKAMAIDPESGYVKRIQGKIKKQKKQ